MALTSCCRPDFNFFSRKAKAAICVLLALLLIHVTGCTGKGPEVVRAEGIVVEDSSGQPLPGLRVVCTRAGYSGIEEPSSFQTVTDNKGRFQFALPLASEVWFAVFHLDARGEVL